MNFMLRTAFVCPLYDKGNHFDFAVDLLRSKKELDISEEMYFVFSCEEHKKKFTERVKTELGLDKIQCLILPEALEGYSSKVVTKKFFALEQLMSLYDYIILVDCESRFVKKCDFGELAEHIWNNRTMLASNLSPSIFFMMRSCYKTLGVYDNKKLRRETETYRYNFWFNELQVYKCSYLPGFFSWLNQHNRTGCLNNYNCFEYYVFFAYLCIEHDFHLLKFRQYVWGGGINESLSKFPPSKQKEIIRTMGVHWTTSEQAITDEIVMLFHLDRTTPPSQQSSNSTPAKRSNKYLKYAGYIYKALSMSLKRRIILFREFFAK